MIEQLQWDPTDAVRVSPADHRNVNTQVLDFISRHIYLCKPEKSNPDWYVKPLHQWSRSVGGFSMNWAFGEADGQLQRDAREISADGRDQYFLLVRLAGVEMLSQLHRTISFGPGSFSLISSSEPIIHRSIGAGELLYFGMPRKFVDQRLVCGEQICIRPHENCTKGLSKLAFETVVALYKNARDMSDTEFLKSSQLAADLVLFALSEFADMASGETPVRTANLLRAKRIIRRRMAEPDLTPSDIANSSGLSLSYLHELFHDSNDGVSVAQYLKNERLKRAREILASPTRHLYSITRIAFDCGFTNLAHFSRSFKAAYGVSPSDVYLND